MRRHRQRWANDFETARLGIGGKVSGEVEGCDAPTSRGTVSHSEISERLIPCRIVSQSDLLPMITATSGLGDGETRGRGDGGTGGRLDVELI